MVTIAKNYYCLDPYYTHFGESTWRESVPSELSLINIGHNVPLDASHKVL